MKKKSLGYYLIVLILGAVVGSVIGDFIGQTLPQSTFRSALLNPLKFSVGPAVVNLKLIAFTLGVSINVNIAGVFGFFVVAYFFHVMEKRG